MVSPQILFLKKEMAVINSWVLYVDDTTPEVSVVETASAAAASEHSDEFIRNFFIKFGMKKTLEAF